VDRDEAIQLPMNLYGVPWLHVCYEWHIAHLNEVEEKRVETDYNKFDNETESNRFWVHEKENMFSCLSGIH